MGASYKVCSPVPNSDRTSEFLTLFTAHDRGLRKYILTLLGDADSAQEVFQETSATLWQKFGEFQPGSNFFAWACRIAYFEVLEFRRRRRRQRLTFNEGLLETLSRDLTEREGVLQARRVALPDCMERLPVVDRELIEQRYAGGETILEIAQRTGRPVHARSTRPWGASAALDEMY